MKTDGVFVIIPAYNEASVIGPVVASLWERRLQVIVVDDGSTDDTAAQARQNGALVVSHAVNRGAGAATETGLEAARQLGAQAVVIMDGDGQHHAEDIEALLGPILEDRADVVIGSRFIGPNHIPLLKRIYNQIANLMTFVLSGTWVKDSQSGFRALGPRALAALTIDTNGYEFASEMFSKIKFHHLKYVEVPISVSYSGYSKGKGQNFANGAETVFRLLIRSLMR